MLVVVVIVVVVVVVVVQFNSIQFKVTMDMLPVRGPDPGTPPPTGWGTVLPTRMCLSPPGHYANKAHGLQAARYVHTLLAQATSKAGASSAQWATTLPQG